MLLLTFIPKKIATHSQKLVTIKTNNFPTQVYCKFVAQIQGPNLRSHPLSSPTPVLPLESSIQVFICSVSTEHQFCARPCDKWSDPQSNKMRSLPLSCSLKEEHQRYHSKMQNVNKHRNISSTLPGNPINPMMLRLGSLLDSNTDYCIIVLKRHAQH